MGGQAEVVPEIGDASSPHPPPIGFNITSGLWFCTASTITACCWPCSCTIIRRARPMHAWATCRQAGVGVWGGQCQLSMQGIPRRALQQGSSAHGHRLPPETPSQRPTSPSPAISLLVSTTITRFLQASKQGAHERGPAVVTEVQARFLLASGSRGQLCQ